MVIAGEMQEDHRWSSAEIYVSLLKSDVLDKANHRLLKEGEAQEATDLLTDIVKGLADMVTGRHAV